MSLSEICIHRPVFATVLSLLVVVLGVVGYQALNVREYPNIDEPAVSVTTTYPGAGAEIMETQVTVPLEDALSGIEGIRSITSSSREGVSTVNLRFVLERDPDSAASDVRDRVSRARGRLPDEADEPIVAKVEADSSPIIFLVLSSEALSGGALTDLADRVVRERIQSLPGVAEVSLFGARVYAMRVWLDPVRLSANNLTATEIAEALERQNIDLPSGRLIAAAREFAVQTRTDLNTPEEFRQLVVATREGVQVRLGDVARIEFGVADETTTFRFNGKPTVALGIIRQAVANPLEIATELRKQIPAIQVTLPGDVELAISNDSTVFISESLKNVYKTLVEALVLVGVVILLFLRNWRAALIPLLAIPVSLMGAFFIMYLLGFSLNTLTLLALVLAIGLVVDDAIVMLENIYRYIEEGLTPIKAALKGAQEVGFAIVAMTVTLAAVYVPVVFMGGRTGKLFTEFALTLTAAVIVSGFVALTLSPMLGGHLLKNPEKKKPNAKSQNPWANALGKASMSLKNGFNRLESGYVRTLNGVLAQWRWVWLVLPVLVLVLFGVFSQLRSELSPVEDRARLFVSINGPEGATSDAMAIYARQLSEKVAGIPEVEAAGFITGVGSGRLPLSNQGFGFLALQPWGERERPSSAVAAQVRALFAEVPGLTAVPILPQSLGAGGRSQPIEIVIQDGRPYSEIFTDLEGVMEQLNTSPLLSGPENTLRLNTPQVVVQLNRRQMADLGVSAEAAGRGVELMLAGRTVGRFKANGEQYDVLMQMEETRRFQPTDISGIFVRNTQGQLVPLASFATVMETVTPRDLNRYGRARSVTVTSGLAPGVALSEGLAFVEDTIRSTFPNGVQLAYAGQTLEYQESGSALWLTFGLALLFIYLVLAAQFESFRDPFIILITVPLTMLGAVLALWVTGNSLNIYSQIGLITLIGLTAKNGILMVEFANLQREANAKMSAVEAMLAAAKLRVRPILMTTIATILGAIPLAIASGAGAETRQQLGWVIVGGMSLGTLLTLFVLPAVYCWLAQTHKGKQTHAA